MIVIFTSNAKGGILQFSILINRILNNSGEETILFCPKESIVDSSEDNVFFYERPRTIRVKNKEAISISNTISNYKPKFVLFMDDVISSAEVALNLNDNITSAMIIHDVTPHVTKNIKKIIKRKIVLPIIEKSYLKQKKLVALSNSGKAKMFTYYPEHKEKITVFPLGAHLTTEQMEKPQEIEDITEYVLFFGRIDKYKGIDTLVDQYEKVIEQKSNIPLVIAGNGYIEEEIRNKIANLSIKLINRYIKDEEMNWLFAHSRIVVLPYIEASQSGIIPIAYHYRKPVLVSNLPGLTENVLPLKTGDVFYDKETMHEKIVGLYETADFYRDSIVEYEANHLDWKKNITNLIKEILE